jgi:transcriptional regulator with XRE-family HTH domain
METGEIDQILSFGDWIQHRRQVMGLTRADLAQKVGCAVITIKKIERDERKPSPQIAELLALHLAIPNSLRAEFMQRARGFFVASPNDHKAELRIPTFLQQDTTTAQPGTYPFVERQRELDGLEKHLQRALAGDGLPVFIFGDAGSGKTSLMTEFARRAMEINPELLVAGGQCNAQSGLGDPYRPFRDILGMLAGDMDTSWLMGRYNRQDALRIWSSIPELIRTITIYGPNLLNLLLPVIPFAHRIEPYLTGPADWLDRMQTLAQSDQSNQAQLGQDQVLEETT